MKISQIFFLSLKNLADRKIRSILTISGVCIGFGFIVYLLSLGYGVEKLTTDQISSPDTLSIFEISLSEDGESRAIDDKNIAEIGNINNVEHVEAAAILPASINVGPVKNDTIVKAYTRKFFELEELKIINGRLFIEDDSREVLITKGLQKILNISDNESFFPALDVKIMTNLALSPTNESDDLILIKSLKVVGIIEDDSPSVIVPFKTVRSSMDLVNYNVARVKVIDANNLTETRRQVEKLGFSTNYIGDTVSQIKSFFNIFRFILMGFGIIAMIVALLGMFNTLTVSLLERTQEIGVMKSLGAKRKTIWWLFISESLIIGFLGGVLGIIMGNIAGKATNTIFNFYALQNGGRAVDFFYTPIYLVLVMLILSILVGLITGLYPAKRAVKIKLLDAIKYE